MGNGIKEQITIFEYCPELLPPAPQVHITDLQLEKVYKGLFPIKWMQKKVESADLKGTIELIRRFTTGGSLRMGIGWSETNPTIINLDRRGIEFDNDGIYHSFHDVAVLLIHKYAKGNQAGKE